MVGSFVNGPQALTTFEGSSASIPNWLIP